MRLIIQNNYSECSQWAANYVAYKIKAFRPTPKKPFVLGLATGSSPLGMYEELIRMYQAGRLSFANVVTFNMDEYIGLGPNDVQSYHNYMYQNFFNYIDIPKANIHLLNGLTKDYLTECENYEETIKRYGKIHLQIGGVGSDGHIAFNEPGSSLSSRTRVKTLTSETIEANSRFFGGDAGKVPTTVLTMGIGTIMDAEEVLIIATGDKKARALHHAVEGSINHMWPISILQMHQHGIIVCDEPATNELKADTVRYFKDIENQLRPKIK